MQPLHTDTNNTLWQDYTPEYFEPMALCPESLGHAHYDASQLLFNGMTTSEQDYLQSSVYTANLAQCDTYEASTKSSLGIAREPESKTHNDIWNEYMSNFMQAPAHARR